MNDGLSAKLVRIWWAGFKVLCRWLAFCIVLVILWLPAMALTGLVGDYAGYVLGIILFILIVPIVFYLTSKYLLLLGDNGQNDVRGAEAVSGASPTTPAAGKSTNKTVREKIVISTLAAFLVSFSLGPPDLVSQYALGFMAMFLCGALLLILARTNFMKSVSSPMQTLICILICTASVLSVNARSLYKMAGHINWPPDFSSVSSSASSRVGNLWIMRLSGHGGFWSRETECVILSVDSFPGFSDGESPSTLTFSDGNSVKVTLKRNETLWIDKDHKVTSLGPVLDGEDVSLLRNCRYDENLKISSPDELLALVKKLKTEQATSTAPPEAAI